MAALLSAVGAPCPGPEGRGLDSGPSRSNLPGAGPFKLLVRVSESQRRRVREYAVSDIRRFARAKGRFGKFKKAAGVSTAEGDFGGDVREYGKENWKENERLEAAKSPRL